MRWLSILVLALALVAAGCGGGDDDSSASDTTTIEETTDTTTEETTTEDDGAGTTAEFDFADEDCQALLGVGATIAAAFSGTGPDADTEQLQELASKAPTEIQADVETLAQVFSAYADKLADVGIEAGETPTAEQVQELQAAIASLDQQKVTAASQRVQGWAEENCSG